MFLSFIIPLYNCEQYIANCLNGIFTTKLPKAEYEIIVIDDGSKDGGADIVKSFQREHLNILLYQQKNKGASSARNVGIERAKGDYIWFVDADDWIDEDALMQVFNVYQNDKTVDLYCFNHTSVETDGNKYIEEFKEEVHFDGCTYIEYRPYYYIWNKIFKKECVINCPFPEGTKNTEDWYFDNVVIINMQKIIGIPVNGYYYNTTNMSSTLRNRSSESIRKNSEDTQAIHILTLQFLETLDSERKRKAVTEALNYSVAGFFYAQYADRVKITELKKIVEKYKVLGLYPIPKTLSKRANRFLRLANTPIAFYTAAFIHRIFRL